MNNKTILIVDDSEFDRQLMRQALGHKGFNILESQSGEEALLRIKNEKIDLVLLDILMPGVFGTQVLKQIRETKNAIDLPIIMMTAKTESSDIVGALHLGANDYLTKPVNFEIATSRINTQLKLTDLSKKLSSLKELSTAKAVICTYSHEINNPLSIAIATLETLIKNPNGEKLMERLKTALWRISDIVKKIRATAENDLSFENYSSDTQIIKIKK